jgi:hypothetical protein
MRAREGTRMCFVTLLRTTHEKLYEKLVQCNHEELTIVLMTSTSQGGNFPLIVIFLCSVP